MELHVRARHASYLKTQSHEKRVPLAEREERQLNLSAANLLVRSNLHQSWTGRVRVSDYRLWSIANNVSYFTLDQPSTEPCRYQKHFRDCGNMTVIPSTVARALSEALDRIGL